MAHVVSHSHLYMASVPAETWDEAWFVMMTWKGMLQSYPGHRGTRISAFPLENGDVRLHALTIWDNPEQLEEWLHSGWSADALLGHVEPSPYDLEQATLEDFA